jgi:hypothetical protein
MMDRITILSLSAALVTSTAFAAPAVYDTPQSALDAFAAALEAGDRDAVLTVFGPEAEDVISTGDEAEDRQNREKILALYREGYRFQPDEAGVTLVLGADSWPFPIPMARTDAGWQFDLERGREELLDREIGRNELDVIDLLEAYVDLQAAFRLVDHDGDGVMEFASTIISASGERDGLFWPDAPGFVGQVLARAELSGWSDGETDFAPEPFHGYYFTILHAQGESAPGGAFSYFVGDNLIAGHAMLAIPAAYGETGIHAFVVGENGVVYEAEFGEDTLVKALEITSYDPNTDWSVVELP